MSQIHIFRFAYWFPKKWQALAYPAILPNIYKNPLLIIQIPFFLLCELITTMKIVKRFQIELIFAHWVMPQGLVAYMVKLMRKIPYGLKNYSSDIRVFHKLSFLGRWLARKIITNARVMFCENSRLQSEASELFPLSDRRNIKNKIVPLCMGVSNLSDGSIANNSKDLLYDFGFIGRLTRKKGVHFFIEALQNLQESNQSVKTIIAGDGEEREYLLEMSKGVNIEFTGFVSGQEKLDFFRKSKFFIFPSCPAKGDVEGLPVALLEALYSGKIAIASHATNIKLLPEWNEIKDSVFLLENPYNIGAFTMLLQKLLQMNDEEIKLRSNQTKAIMQKYSWDNLIYQYIDRMKDS